jgi:hypothetical protein
MKPSLSSFEPKFNTRVKEAQRFAIFVRGREFQESAISNLENLIAEIETLKQSSINLADEDNANGFLALELIARGLQKEILCYVKLKSDDAGAAWDALADCERNIRNAMSAHRLADHLSNYVARIQALQELLFPKQRFFSMGCRVESSICSICGSEYDECEHIVGRPYMGQLCAQIVKRMTMAEVSLVENPSSKLCRVTSFSEDREDIDILTLRPLPKAPETA